jgi:hypothetical protein
MSDYLKLDAHGKDAWKRDGAIQTIIGQDLQRLDGVSQIGDMSRAFAP